MGDGWKIVAMSYTNGCLFASSFHFVTYTAERQPGYFINCCRETTKMGVPPGNRPTVPRDGSEAYLNGTLQGPPVLSEVEGTPEDARLPARRAYSSERRRAISVVAASDE